MNETLDALIAEHESAAGAHYIHSSAETLERLEKARAALRAWLLEMQAA